jgi:hypothetical protein
MDTLVNNCFLNGIVEKDWVVVKGWGVGFVFSSNDCFLSEVEKGEGFFLHPFQKRMVVGPSKIY